MISAFEGSKCSVLASTDNMPHEDWLEYRKLGLGGSDASVVCGINRYKSPVELFMEKTGMFPYEEAGEAAYWGTQLEGLVKAEFTKRTGIEVVPVNLILQSEAYPFMLANLDGVCQHPIYGACVFEAKTTGAFNGGRWSIGGTGGSSVGEGGDNSNNRNNSGTSDGEGIPDEFILQVQHYLSVTGFQGAYVAVLIGGNQFKWRFIERDEELISMLIQLETEFWHCVRSNIPPPLDGSEASQKFLARRFPDSVPQSRVDLPESAVEHIRRYEAACVEVDRYTERKVEAESFLKQMLGEYEVGVIADIPDGEGNIGDYAVTWKSVTQERLDSKTLKVEHPKLYKKFAVKSSHRRFSVRQLDSKTTVMT